MIYFNNDYSEGCHEKILEALIRTNNDQTPGYGTDSYCEKAAAYIRKHCNREDLSVHFLVGGTQTNLTVIAAALRPHQGVLCADSGHIHVHETGAVESTGHKVLALPATDGKITAAQIKDYVSAHYADDAFEHIVQPKLVYLSQSTEFGTLYSLEELSNISAVCKECGLYLFVDGARLAYALTAEGNDVTLEGLAQLCDVFYIGGTKCGALFGEAVVITNALLNQDFRYMIKQRGGMLAKGRLLGVQFAALFEKNLYYEIAERANKLADQIRTVLAQLQYPLFVNGVSNQIFVTLPDSVLEKLEKEFVFSAQCRVDDAHRVVRICTSWATTQENTEKLCCALRNYS